MLSHQREDTRLLCLLRIVSCHVMEDDMFSYPEKITRLEKLSKEEDMLSCQEMSCSHVMRRGHVVMSGDVVLSCHEKMTCCADAEPRETTVHLNMFDFIPPSSLMTRR